MQIFTSQEQLRNHLSSTKIGFFDVKISNAVFDFPITLEGSHYRLMFDTCVFQKEVLIQNATIEKGLTLKGCTFHSKFSLAGTTIKEKARIQGSFFFGKTDFHNTKFLDLADFWDTEFHKSVIFNKTDFGGKAVFSIVEFRENVLFTYSLIKDVAIFRGTDFKKGFDISQAIINGSLNIFDIKITPYTTQSTTDNEEYERFITEEAIIPAINKRETFRILKKQLREHGNIYDALKYARYETFGYQVELRNEQRHAKGLSKSLSLIEKRIILNLNKFSNYHNSSWALGIGFTLLMGLIFFYASVLSTENIYFVPSMPDEHTFSMLVKAFWTSLSPLHKSDYLDTYGATGWTYFWDSVGRIFVSYGIYQTVQAFRQFKGA